MAEVQGACPPQPYPPAPAVEGYPPPGAYVAPPPAGNPGAEYAGQQQSQAPGATTDRGDGFWGDFQSVISCALHCCSCMVEPCV